MGHTAREGACLIWTAGSDKDGYGVFYFRRQNRRAHRAAYWAWIGDIPVGHVVDHICQNPACVEPTHLRVLTSRENTLNGRGVGAMNARRTHCKYGHPFDRSYGKQRYCSVCSAAKTKRLRAKWRAEDTLAI